MDCIELNLTSVRMKKNQVNANLYENDSNFFREKKEKKCLVNKEKWENWTRLKRIVESITIYVRM